MTEQELFEATLKAQAMPNGHHQQQQVVQAGDTLFPLYFGIVTKLAEMEDDFSSQDQAVRRRAISKEALLQALDALALIGLNFPKPPGL